jgi:hypothetical protein
MKAWHGIGVAVVLLVLAGAWFLSSYEQVATKVWVGPTAAARANPYLAAMRFAERLGMTATLVTGNRRLGEMPARAAALLPDRPAGLAPEQVRALDRWMRSGGHVIVEAAPVGQADALLDRYGIARAAPGRDAKATKQQLLLPGADAPIVVSRAPAPLLRFRRDAADIVAADDSGTSLASLPIGAGRLTIVAGLPNRFQNRTIGQDDNAELLRSILGFAPAARELIVLRVPQALPIWGWLAEHALPTFAAVGTLILLGLLRTLPRFGPLMPDPSPIRRPLREHILAAGRFRWTHGGRDGLIAAARDVAQRQIVLMHPRIARMPPPARWQELAKRIGLDAGAITHAFESDARSAREFVHAIDALASIHANIGAPAEPRSTRASSS